MLPNTALGSAATYLGLALVGASRGGICTLVRITSDIIMFLSNHAIGIFRGIEKWCDSLFQAYYPNSLRISSYGYGQFIAEAYTPEAFIPKLTYKAALNSLSGIINFVTGDQSYLHPLYSVFGLGAVLAVSFIQPTEPNPAEGCSVNNVLKCVRKLYDNQNVTTMLSAGLAYDLIGRHMIHAFIPEPQELGGENICSYTIGYAAIGAITVIAAKQLYDLTTQCCQSLRHTHRHRD